jgi:hypothetical protein
MARPATERSLVLTSSRIVAKPNTMKPAVRSQVVDVPVGSEGSRIKSAIKAREKIWTGQSAVNQPIDLSFQYLRSLFW